MTRAGVLFGAMLAAVPLLGVAEIRQTRDIARPAATGDARITGMIVSDEATNQPVRAAIVTLNGTEGGVGRTVVSDDAGRFTFDRLPAGRFLVSASKRAYVTMNYGATRPGRAGVPIAVAAGQTSTIKFAVPRGAVITGRVMDDRGTPLAHQPIFVLEFRWQNGQRTLTRVALDSAPETDDRGVYRAYGLPAGEYLIAAAPGLGTPINTARDVTAADLDRATREIQGTRGTPATDTRAPSTAAAPSGRVTGPAPVFHPNTPDAASAVTISLNAGEERSGIDVRFLPVPISTITGTVTAPDGAVALTSIQVSMAPNGPAIPTQGFGIGASIGGYGSTRARADGQFTLAGVSPGRYLLVARVAPAPAPRGSPPPAATPAASGGAGAASLGATTTYWAVADVVVNGDDVVVPLDLRPAGEIHGRIVFDGALPPPADLTRLRISLTAALASSTTALGVPPAQAHDDRTFVVTGVTPAKYRISASGLPMGWALAAATVQGRDVLDGLLDVGPDALAIDLVLTLSDHPSELSGTLQNPAGRPAPEYVVVVFPTDRAGWTWLSRRVQAVRPGTNGVFTIPNLPPGEYYLGAVSDVETNEWFDPAFLERLVPASTTITLAAGEKKTQDLRVVR